MADHHASSVLCVGWAKLPLSKITCRRVNPRPKTSQKLPLTANVRIPLPDVKSSLGLVSSRFFGRRAILGAAKRQVYL